MLDPESIDHVQLTITNPCCPRLNIAKKCHKPSISWFPPWENRGFPLTSGAPLGVKTIHRRLNGRDQGNPWPHSLQVIMMIISLIPMMIKPDQDFEYQLNPLINPYHNSQISFWSSEVLGTSFKNGKLSADLTASYQWVLRFFQSICLNYCAYHEKVMPGHTKCCTCHAKSSQQTWKSEAPKCNPSQEISARTSQQLWWTCLLYCTWPNTENVSLQILFKCPTPIVFGNATKPARFAHFWQGPGPQSLAPATRNDIWVSKSCAKMLCF